MKLIIFGSCVSRDVLNFDINKRIELVDYYARCSLVSLFSQPSPDPKLLEKIKSEFQKKMVGLDMSKAFLKDICKKEVDLMLVDFIDERFSLHQISQKQIRTCSTEYKRAIGQDVPMKLIGAFSEKKMDMWRDAFDQFVQVCSNIKIKVNKVWWTKLVNDGSRIKNIPEEKVDLANLRLEEMYRYAEAILGSDCFIDYEKSLFVSDVNHIWGVSPFHYNERLYRKTLASILEMEPL